MRDFSANFGNLSVRICDFKPRICDFAVRIRDFVVPVRDFSVPLRDFGLESVASPFGCVTSASTCMI